MDHNPHTLDPRHRSMDFRQRNMLLDHRDDFGTTFAVLMIQVAIFLSAGVCLGLPLLIWALRRLHVFLRRGGRVTAFVASALLFDFLELVMSSVVVIVLARGVCLITSIKCRLMLFLWLGMQFCGLHFHQLAALEGVLALVNPMLTASWPFVLVTVAASLLEWVFLVAYVGAAPHLECPAAYIVWFLLAVVLFIATAVLTFLYQPPEDQRWYRAKKNGRLALAAASLLVVYVPHYFARGILFEHDSEKEPEVNEYAMVGCLSMVVLQLVVDPLLCVLYFKDIPEIQIDTDIPSVPRMSLN
ncbi:uncharacterized protein LOC134059574 [Sardina pilchardus]|uniref:uncharacterized protein LOC134059574 n=1 Tax=Sardina pilchardus TaxID=27697 RepID=UPI002E14839E